MAHTGRVRVVAKFECKPGKEEEVISALRKCAVPTKQEAGAIQYQLTQSVSDPTVVVMVEEWESQAALDAHLKTAHLQALLAAMGEPGAAAGLLRAPIGLDILKDI
eukprot:tig00000670_g3015.t1